ncbi:MAG: type IX secretion system outer membrane channel protein PorV [Paludibacteraceae bacterium]|nr:type IX secretion system outer membrane channel protein PorV [Paludibacteraceae bacterium]
MKKIILSILTLVGLALPALATNPVITAMPSLTIAPDAHAAGMADIGAATNPDLNSQHWNPSKYAFMESKGGITVNYTPWLTKLVNDINLAYIAGYYNIGEMAGTVSGSFRYFSMGEVTLMEMDANYQGSPLGTAHPNEWALDVAYSRKLHEYLSMAVALRFMYSDLNNGINSSTSNSPEMFPAWTMAADVSLYYRQPIPTPMGESYFALGFNLSNLGGKMSYDEGYTKHFIPANMRLGVSYELPFDDYNRLMISAEANKMLVPTYNSKFANDGNGGQYDQVDYAAVSSPKGWWQSFCDAPGYFNENTGKHVSATMEELQEIQWGIGLEYSYNRQFFGRVGYSHENYYKGNRRYVTLGAGFKLSIFSLDFAYCIATAPSNPLDGTMRFTLGFDLAGIKDLVNNKK